MKRFFRATVWVISRLLCTFTLVQTSLASILAPKKLKIMFCGIWSIKSCSNWSYCALWVLYSLISIFWYQKYISLILYWNFTSQNRRKIPPKMRPEVVIWNFCFHDTLILLHTCFQCVLLNEAGHSRQSLRYFMIIVHFYVSSSVTGLHFGVKKAKNHVLLNLEH